MVNHSNHLVVVGTGIRFYSQLTLEAISHIEKAEKVVYLVNEPLTETWIQELNPAAESLAKLYHRPGERIEIYREIALYIVEQLRKGLNVCAVFYGHPAVFALPPHLAVKLARKEGYHAIILPGISAEDCLFADIGIDPGIRGCQSFEATDFLVRKREWDTSSHLILWQVGSLGNTRMEVDPHTQEKQKILVEALSIHYTDNHQVAVYEASLYPSVPSRIDWIPLSGLPQTKTSNISTLYVPPLPEKEVDPFMLARLKLPSLKTIS
jgi:uncharacterized protein YabN with tetrapyrrole methylase and pyrophosphatase domain